MRDNLRRDTAASEDHPEKPEGTLTGSAADRTPSARGNENTHRHSPGMADRIDLLGKNSERERLLAAGVLEVALRSDLTDVVRRATETTSYPISIITLMGKRSQFFAASTGLPPELEVIGATDRSVALCQRVVRDKTSFEWEDVAVDADAPQGLVPTHVIA